MSCVYYLSSYFLGSAGEIQLGGKKAAGQAECGPYPHGSYDLDQGSVHFAVKCLIVNTLDWGPSGFCHNYATVQLEHVCGVDDT